MTCQLNRIGENGYDSPVAHDYLGILVAMLTIGHLDAETKILLENLPTGGYKATYEYNFKELEARGFPPHTAGGFDHFAVSSGYNVGFMTLALRGKKYRTEPILAYR